ncbi:hypothetical protein PVL29_012730 [Vitis rotundifolia]|uniref:non-specific serine/threonine protein kinase n=1 Tax=Vitis rotundifolia TaxID=103349 RepID=A0AA39DMN6_VITRO|nr:hypothetical protein PVL29_012730 [Vitis rotundifolia]
MYVGVLVLTYWYHDLKEPLFSAGYNQLEEGEYFGFESNSEDNLKFYRNLEFRSHEQLMEMGVVEVFALWYIFLASISSTTAATDTLGPGQYLRDNQTLVSSSQRFELGFFSPGNSGNRYLGIWYKNLPLTVVWLLLRSGTELVWSSNSTSPANGSVVLQLLDSGNLVVRDVSDTSDDYPTMKLGWKLKTGLHMYLTSWKNADDPSAGDFSYSLDAPDSPQLVLRKGSDKQYRWGPWDGVRFSGSQEFKANPVFTPKFFSDTEEVYYTFIVTDKSALSRSIVTQFGLIQYLYWNNGTKEWSTTVTLQRDNCDRYGMCGPYGNCYSSDPSCRCMKGFSPKSPQSWDIELDCNKGDGFVKYKPLKLPDNSHLWGNSSLSSEDCRAKCLRNCSCMAYTIINVHGNGGDCVAWFGDLVDMKDFSEGGEELYIRMARSEIEAIADAKRKKLVEMIIAIVISIVSGIFILGCIGWGLSRTRRAKRTAREFNSQRDSKEEDQGEDLELPLFDLEVISGATNRFSFEKKIGQGGFGPVYKGELHTGQEIAVKRLSQSSGQGLEEFKNEVILISKLQHRNLVKLLGCCIQREERMLIYEYLPNKSLNYFIFDQTGRKLLTWKKRFDIVLGIARGLLYLHQDSRLRIIHRDLKTSNILLDSEMNPKISDFGIARIFGGDQMEEKTRRVVGTYGYMSPEYALNGQFSVKSDVFSFGVILLEIVSGKKNWGFYHPDHDFNLLGHAWKLWNEGIPLELVDVLLEDSFSADEMVRCIQVALLCVQLRPEDRPIMSSVVFMLSNQSAVAAQPKEPGFVTGNTYMGTDSSSTGKNLHTGNDITSSGNIVIMDSESGIAVWSSNSSGTSPVLQLLNTGNLVVKDVGSDNNSASYIWQSFDHPCDTILPGMKMGSNLETRLEWYMTSWTSKQDPSTGDFTYKVDHRGLPAVVLRTRSQVQFHSGPWDGVRFGGGPELQQNTDGDWIPITTLNADDCDDYEKCGPYGICNFEDQWFCHCPDGFTSKSPQNWNQRQTSDGCQLRALVGDLHDIRVYSEGGQDLYIRMAASELALFAIISTVVVSGVLVAVLVGWYFHRRKTTAGRRADTVENPNQGSNHGIGEEDLELPLFDLATIRAATNDFSFTNKIGQIGFGAVYRYGKLSTGQEIAVKRLSEDSGQGLKEFKNEVILIAQLQHRNLVRLLGCCIHGEERMLIYEYMPNKNQTRGASLDWGARFDIIVGIARGLLYLHRDSRLRIIHRDLKASNVLLDSEMNPKFSDFGSARPFGGDQTEANTKRVMGTYGYMSPEYAIDGVFSVKSDVFSFGVLVLEIVSGKRNRRFYHPDHDLNLLGHAWKLWNEGRAMELVDVLMEGPLHNAEVLLCVQMGLLCVQQRHEDRPTMSWVVLMLDSENPILPQPKQPGCYTERFPVDTDSSSTGKRPATSNELTVTMLHAREKSVPTLCIFPSQSYDYVLSNFFCQIS